MAQELAKPEKKEKIIIIDSKTKKPLFVWDYKEQKKVAIDPDKLMGISMFNKDLDKINNKNQIIYPEEADSDTENVMKKGSDNFKEPDINPADDERSIIIDKLRDLVIRFENLMQKYLDPDLPTGRKAKKKYMMERELFASNGFKEFIRIIERKVDALCKYEDEFTCAMFDHGEKKGWFKEQCELALQGDFIVAQDVLNSVEQLVVEDQLAVPVKRIVTKIR